MIAELVLIERCYGGPEEGGWWYDSPTVLRRYVGPKRIAKKRFRQYQREARELQPRRTRFSMAGGPDWCARLGRQPTEELRRRPRYE